MEEESLQCECWLHQHCIGMTWTQYVNFSKPHLQFFCRQCIGSGNGFNLLSSLSRIAALRPDIGKMRAQAESEMNLLQFYRAVLPDVVPSRRRCGWRRRRQCFASDSAGWAPDSDRQPAHRTESRPA